MRLLPALTLVLVCLLGPGASFAQGVRAVATSDGIDAIAVGDAGALYRSLDGGTSWQDYSIGGTANIEGIAWRQSTVVMVGSGGTIWRSANGGAGWVTTIEPGVHDLHDVTFATPAAVFAVGNGGTILGSTDGGVTWTPRSSTTVSHLRAVEFGDATHGWAAGDGGTLLRTLDGGASWGSFSLGTGNDLLDVDQAGSVVWVVGRGGAAFKSINGGTSFVPVNLKLDAESDVCVVHMQGPDTLWIAGGGGFIRYSVNGGATWTFQQHRMHHPITAMASFGAKVFASNPANKVVMWTSDRGAFWRFGATLTRTWVGPKVPALAQVRGNTLNYLPRWKRFYCAFGNRIYRSYDLGETWSQVDTMPAAYTKCNAFIVSPKDTNLMVAAVGASAGGAPDRIIRSTNGGADWTIVLTHDFGEYGIPLEMHPDKNDTLFFGGENSGGAPPDMIWRSTDFGATWAPYSNSVFRSPCDIVVIPDTSLVLVGDGITGTGTAQFFRSTDNGANFTLTAAGTASEIPSMATSRLRPNVTLATNWDVGGVYRTLDYGASWSKVDLTNSAWGTDIAKDDPNVMMFAQYVGSFSYISVDGGTTWANFAVPGSFGNNYSLYARDRNLVLAEQSSGIWKMKADYIYTPMPPAQTLTLSAPNGGEVWSPGEVHPIGWVASQVPVVRLEYRRAPTEPWRFIADVPGYFNSATWTVPADAGTQVKFRVSDAADGAPLDSSNAVFTITGPRLLAAPSALDFGSVQVGSGAGRVLTLTNDGTVQVNVTSATTGTSAYVVSRGSLTLAPSQSDTVSVWFQPPTAGAWPDTLRLTSNDAAHSPLAVPLSGFTPPTLTLLSPVAGQFWQYRTVHNVAWSSSLIAQVDLDYRVSPAGAWKPIASNLPASPGSYTWTIPYDPTSTAQVRVRSSSGGIESVSGQFSLTSPLCDVTPDTLWMQVVLGSSGQGLVWLTNGGNAQLTIQSITTSNPEFWTSRTSLVIPPSVTDTVTVFYQPAAEGRDTAFVTLVSNNPLSPQNVVVLANGTTSVGTPAPSTRPAQFALSQNQPNPFTRTTQIRYALPVAADVSLEVFNLHGQRVATLARGPMDAGQYTASFGPGASTASGVRLGAMPAGVYFLRMQAGPYLATRKMLLVR